MWKSLSIIIFLYCCMLIWSQISDYTCTTLFWDRCKWLKILIHRYREVGDSWFLQCVAMCFVSLVSKHPLQLNDVVQQTPRNSAWKQRKLWKTCSWPGHELLHTTIIIFFDSVLNDLTWPRYLLSSRIFYYLLSVLLILYKT